MNKSSGERSRAPKAPLWLLVLNMGCGTLGITIISPALGLVTNDFGVDEATGQWILSAYFGAIALVQLLQATDVIGSGDVISWVYPSFLYV